MGQRLGAVIPEPLKKLYLCIPRKYLDAPNCFVLPECLKNEDGKIRMDFSDNGRGLAERYLKNPQAIFELGETTTIGGFGIGAFHMKEIVENIGGKIFAIQNEGKGLTIRVVI